MPGDLRILIADDHPLMRQGLRHVIETDPALTIVGEVGTGAAALEEIQKLRPSMAILDIDMPDLDGFAVVRALRERQVPVDIIFLTVYRDARFFNEALTLGARAYVLKDSAATEILSSIRAVAKGDHYTSPALTPYLVQQRRGASDRKAGLDDLSPTERRILALIADYKTSREIAETLHVSYRTVQTHRSNICTKLDLEGSHALMKFALEHKADL